MIQGWDVYLTAKILYSAGFGIKGWHILNQITWLRLKSIFAGPLKQPREG